MGNEKEMLFAGPRRVDGARFVGWVGREGCLPSKERPKRMEYTCLIHSDDSCDLVLRVCPIGLL